MKNNSIKLTISIKGSSSRKCEVLPFCKISAYPCELDKITLFVIMRKEKTYFSFPAFGRVKLISEGILHKGMNAVEIHIRAALTQSELADSACGIIPEQTVVLIVLVIKIVHGDFFEAEAF